VKVVAFLLVFLLGIVVGFFLGVTGSAPGSPSSPGGWATYGAWEEKCRGELKFYCAIQCIESEEPPNRPACEVACLKRPLSYFDGKIPECTQGIR